MLCTLMLVLSAQVPVAPALPAGCDPVFQRACLKVERALESGDFEAAKAALPWLPASAIRIAWDDSAVPANQKAAYAQARDRSFTLWRKAVPELAFSVGEPADIRVTFKESIDQEGTDLVKPGARHLLLDSTKPHVQSTIALVRGNPTAVASERDVQNEVGYAIGAYLGLAPSPFYGQIMGRTDQANKLTCAITDDERERIKANLAVIDVLRKACENRVKMTPAISRIEIGDLDRKEVAVIQGAKPVFKFVLANRGNAPLNYRIASTCACLVTDANRAIAPGASRTVQATFDTTEFTGNLVKHLYVYSNDPERPIVEIPVKAVITPRYRFLNPAGDVLLLNDGTTVLEIYLTFPAGSPLEPIATIIDSLKGVVTVEPWQGTLPDPDFNEGPKARKGYKLTAKLADQAVYGRTAGAIIVTTGDAAFGKLQYSFWAQKGIVALPLPLYLGGALSTAPAKGDVIVSRPGKPFKITSITSDLACLSASFEPSRDGSEYKVTVHYDGKAKSGQLRGMLDVHTDDPKQPIVKVMVMGVVR